MRIHCCGSYTIMSWTAFRIVNLLIGFLLMAHWLACGFFFVGKINDSGDVTWVDEQWPQRHDYVSFQEKYTTCVA